MLIGLTAGTAWSQVSYVSPAVGVGGGTLADPADPGNLCDAVAANAGGDTIYALINAATSRADFEQNLDATVNGCAIDADVTFDTYLYDPVGATTTLSLDGSIGIDGFIAIEPGVDVDIPGNVALQVTGTQDFYIGDGASVSGEGLLDFSTASSDGFVKIGPEVAGVPPFAASTVSFENLAVNRIGGSVTIIDEAPGDAVQSGITITNSLTVGGGVLDISNNLLSIESTDDMTTDPGVHIAGGASVTGVGGAKAIFAIEDHTTGFDNCRPGVCGTDPFMVTGAGDLDLNFDKTTDGGVYMELGDIGAGGTSRNLAGALFVTDATTVNGIFRNEGASRTEFDSLELITEHLFVIGSGEVGPGDGVCDTDGNADPDDNGVYFFNAVTIEGNMTLEDTSDDTNGTGEFCDEGVEFRADLLDSETVVSSLMGLLISTNSPGSSSGIRLDAFASGEYHNFATYADHQMSGETPNYQLDSPADNYGATSLCTAYTNEASGNKKIFAGGANQLLTYESDEVLDINSVKIEKEASGDDVEILDGGGEFLIDTALEILRGNFVTNGLLDLNSGTTDTSGGTVTINRDGEGDGVLQAGDADRAYVSDADEHTPRKVKYTGTVGQFTGDEIEGTPSGSVGQPEVAINEVEVALANDAGVITASKDFTIKDETRLTRGKFDVGSSIVTFGNDMLIAYGDGNITREGVPPFQGGIDFPTDDTDSAHTLGDAFVSNVDGIDHLYFGTVSPRVVDFGWPNSTENPDVVRNVEIDPACSNDLEVDLRAGEDFRANPADEDAGDGDTRLDAAGFHIEDGGTLDLNGSILEIAADNGADNEFHVNNDAYVIDTEADGGAIDARTAYYEQVNAARHAYRAAQTPAEKDAAIEMFKGLEEARAGFTANKSAGHGGLLRFMGDDYRTEFWCDTDEDRLHCDMPAAEVDRTGDGTVTINGGNTASTTGVLIAANNIDIISFDHFVLKDGDMGSAGSANSGSAAVELMYGVDVFAIDSYYNQHDGEFLMSGISSCGKVGNAAKSAGFGDCDVYQLVDVAGDFRESDGEFFSAGGDVFNGGNFELGGPDDATAGNSDLDARWTYDDAHDILEPNDALFDQYNLHCGSYIGSSSKSEGGICMGGVHVSIGNFMVSVDTSPDEREDDVDEDGDTDYNPEKRNRYFQGYGLTVLYGHVHMRGTFDNFDDHVVPWASQGAFGTTIIAGSILQDFEHNQMRDTERIGDFNEDAFWNNLHMDGTGDDNDTGLLMLDNAVQNDYGYLNLSWSIIDTNDEMYDWWQLNTQHETSLAGRNNAATCNSAPPAPPCGAATELGSRDSYIKGANVRRVEAGNATGGIVTGGYLFAVGTEGDDRTGDGSGNTGRVVDFFRPAILQFADDLGRAVTTRFDYEDPIDMSAKAEADDKYVNAPDGDGVYRPIKLDFVGDVVDAGGGRTLDLNVLGDQFWIQQDNDHPSFDPNLRLELQGLERNIFNIKAMRIVHWTCDGTYLGLAGIYDVTGGVVDDASAVLNDFINGVPNITQEGVQVRNCNVYGVATDGFINPIHLDPIIGGLAHVQLIHNSPGAPAVGVCVDGTPWVSSLAFQEATAYGAIASGDHTVSLIAADDADCSNPIASVDVSLAPGSATIAMAQGVLGSSFEVTTAPGRLASTGGDFEYRFTHSVPDFGEADVRMLDENDNNNAVALLVNNAEFGDVTGWMSLAAGTYNLELTNGDNSVQVGAYRFDLSDLSGMSGVLSASGLAADGSAMLIGWDAAGNTIYPQVVTSTDEDTELPTDFAVLGNYPNPFNPSTRISFDLPETADVTVEVIDILGRHVMTIGNQVVEAGANRGLNINAASLASGTYIYRVIAKTASDTMIKTGRMMLIK